LNPAALSDEETDALRRRAERTSRRELLDDVLDEELPRFSEALRRLGE
jgi:hypothetical protein